MAILKIILYSTQKSQRIVYQDADGVMTSEIENTYFSACEVEHRNSAWARIIVSDKTKNALKALETKYDQATRWHIRKLYGFISKFADGDVFYYFNEEKASVVRPKGDGIVRIQKQTSGRKGAGVSVITGLDLSDEELKKLAAELKKRCGCGGSVKNGMIEIQGEKRDLLKQLLEQKGFTVKLSGG